MIHMLTDESLNAERFYLHVDEKSTVGFKEGRGHSYQSNHEGRGNSNQGNVL